MTIQGCEHTHSTRQKISATKLLVTPWTPDRIELLEKLFHANMSAADIANEMGNVTRNAVLGKLHRLGLKETERNRPRAERQSRAKPIRSHPFRRSQSKPPLVFIAQPDEAIPEHILFEQLTKKTCKWPYGDFPPFSFCGCEVLTGPYCYSHSLKATGIGTRAERMAEAA